MRIVSGNGLRISGSGQQDHLIYTISEAPIDFSGSSSPVSHYDIDLVEVSSPNTHNAFRVEVQDAPSYPDHRLVNMTPSVCSLSDGNLVSLVDGVDNGEAVIDVISRVSHKRYTRQLARSGQSDYYAFQGFKSGSFGEHVSNTVAALISGKTCSAGTTLMWSSNNFDSASPSVVRNPNNFAASLDLSPISVINGGQAIYHPALLIGGRHIVAAQHFRPTNPITFMRTNGTFQTVNVSAWALDVAGSGKDVAIGYLDAGVTGCTPFKILPSNYGDYLKAAANYDPSLATGARRKMEMPVLIKSAHNRSLANADNMLLAYCNYICSVELAWITYWCGVAEKSPYPETATFTTDPWCITGIIGGDSGSPVFFPHGSDLVLLGAMFFPGAFTSLAHFKTQIDAAMNALATASGDPAAGTYAVQTVDLSGFTSYP